MPFTVDHGPLNKRAMVKTDDLGEYYLNKLFPLFGPCKSRCILYIMPKKLNANF
jgi:hypothetical protein